MEFLKSAAGKILSGVVGLIVVISAISWWRMDERTRAALLSGSGKIGSWLGVVLLVPWATFFLIGRIGQMRSNAAGAALVLGYTIVEMVLLGWLFGWTVGGGTAWTFFVLGGLFAAVYNLFACDWIAERME
ncbi:MAG TPA: hypothetical protein VIL86_05610 [Tepidisphaeraceae bacterium]